MIRFVKTATLLSLCFPLLPGLLTAQSFSSTDFGSEFVGGTSPSQTVTVNGVSSGDSFSLQSGNEFSIANRSCTGNTCTLTVTFSPTAPGLRQAAIVATSPGGQLLATASLYGVGVGPQISFTPGIIQTVANRAANNLATVRPAGIALGNGANVFFSDSTSHRVWQLNTTTGQVSVYAGNGSAGFSGDGGAATTAALNQPRGLAFDGAGDLFIVDSGNNRIRRVDGFSGIVTTVAGNGTAGFSGDGGPAINAQLNGPGAIAINGAGNLFISDTSNNRVREVTQNNGQISTIAGNGTAGYLGDGAAGVSAELNRPEGLTLDTSGQLYIADVLNNVVRLVSGGTITTVAGNGTAGSAGDGGAATSANLNMPWGVAVDAGGGIYIADTLNNSVRKVSLDTNRTISTVAGNGTAGYSGDYGISTQASFNDPELLALDGTGTLYIVDRANFALRKVTATAAPVVVPNTPNGNTSSSSTVSITNNGNASLTLTGLSADGNFGQQVSANECTSSTTLTVGTSCTFAVAYSATSGAPTTGVGTVTSDTLNVPNTTSLLQLSESAGLRFVPITPCRVADTRGAAGPIVSGGGSPRNFTITGGACGIPSTAQAFAMNVTVVPSGFLGYLTVWPTGESQPVVSLLNSWDGRVKADATIVPAGSGGAISVYATNNTQVVLDVSGYFVSEATDPSGLEFFPLPPCRIADTRTSSGAYSGTRGFQISGNCNVPASAKAYSLNVTAVPLGPLYYLTVWPAGQAQPGVSNINAPTGAVTANGVIVQAGTPSSPGQIGVYASNTTHVVLDVNGYFAPPSTAGLSLYNLTPCRVFDTRMNNGQTLNPFSGPLAVNVTQNNTCNVPQAPVYVLNTTVQPTAGLGFLALWPLGQAQPLVSTLNASDGALTSNLALLPAISGSVSAYASNSTDLFMDISAYFAQ